MPEEKARGIFVLTRQSYPYVLIYITPKACFMALDENEDGELSREEISKFWDIFQHIIEKSDSHKGSSPKVSVL